MMAKRRSEILVDILKSEGMRYTAQRQAVWDDIRDQKHTEHRDAEEIYNHIRGKGIKVSRATVYRTIDVLVKNRLIRKMDLGDGRSLFEPSTNDIYDDRHDHMICTESGKIIEFYDQELDFLQEKIARKHGYTVVRRVHQLFVKPVK